MSFSTGALIVNVNDQTVLHRLAIEGGNFHTKNNKSGSSVEKQADVHTKTDDPTLIAFILQQLLSLTLKDSLCTLTSTSDIFGRRPLHYAAMHGYANITRALLNDLKASGEFIDFSNPYWLDTDGITPLIYAVSRGHANVLKVLVEEGRIRDVDAVNDSKLALHGFELLFLRRIEPCLTLWSLFPDSLQPPLDSKDHANDAHDCLESACGIRREPPCSIHTHTSLDCLQARTRGCCQASYSIRS